MQELFIVKTNSCTIHMTVIMNVCCTSHRTVIMNVCCYTSAYGLVMSTQFLVFKYIIIIK